MTRILFICHGNICRSPMAEFIMKELVRKAGAEQEFEIASAATSCEELGNPVHRGTKRILDSLGLSCAGKTARRMTKQDYLAYDYLIGMDHENLQEMRRIAGGDPEGKLFLLLSFTGSSRGVADPWYTGDFEATYRDITAGCKALLAWLTAQSEKKTSKN